MRTMICMLTGALLLLGCDDKEDAAKKPPSAASAPADKPAAGKAGGESADGALAAATDDAAAPDADPLAGIDKRVMRAATLAKKIEAEPEKAGDILDAAGLQRDEFEELIFEISADASLAKQYQAAMVAQTG